eukprot:TRINITY_DN5216_c0_g2_i1.p1 TRINITY_DN5216_c0_g2~~TRINITY_DN5216_c0_g2_i1.p1  ORF type:complete len:1231 (-),score=160.75 TRINITY_DN5216_c0_g2_i1:203-3349(-)
MTAAEFDITDMLRNLSTTPQCASLLGAQHSNASEVAQHVLVAAVPTWCDGSYMEDQDQWWLTGLHRGVELSSSPEKCSISDYVTDALLRPNEVTGVLNVSVKFSAPAPLGTRLRFRLKGPVHGTGPCPSGFICEHEATVETGRMSWDFSGVEVSSVRAWSAEEPHLYSILIELLDFVSVVQAESFRVGFRTVEICDSQLCVNGRALIIAGANVHEMHPRRGKALTEEDMLLDIQMLKRGNFNAVRNAHYPHHPRWYELCDEYGLYVVDEANIETHGFATNLAVSFLACDPAWGAQFLHRVQNMFLRSRNHACVIVWSLGNESGWGPNLSACATWLRKNDSQGRPVQYEGGEHHGDAVFCGGDGQVPDSDIICPMYWGPPMLLQLVANGGDKAAVQAVPAAGGKPQERPIILCEYEHSMGNANGSLRSFWDLFWSNSAAHRRLQGGFVWEWADGAVKIPRSPEALSIKTEKTNFFLEGELGYGGDFGPESGTVDANFVVDGLLFPDRKPHPAYFDFKRLQQPVAFEFQNAFIDVSIACVTFLVRNRYSFRSLGHLEIVWHVLDGSGRPGISGIASPSLRDVACGETTSLVVQVPAPSRLQARVAGQWILVQAVLREDELSMPRGFVVAEATMPVVSPISPSKTTQRNAGVGSVANETPASLVCCDSAVPLISESVVSTAVRVIHWTALAGTSVEAAGYTATVQGGKIVSFRTKEGPELLAAPLISHSFYRAPTDNDRGGVDFFMPSLMKMPPLRFLLARAGLISNVAEWHRIGFHDLQSIVEETAWQGDTSVSEGTRPTLTVIERFMAVRVPCFLVKTCYGFEADEITVEIEVSALSATWNMPNLPRIGAKVEVMPRFSRLAWLGCGPGESYPDRKEANDWAVYCEDVDRLHVDYIMPSENGGKADVHWAALTDPSRQGEGILFRYSCHEAAPSRERAEDGPSESRPAGTRGAQLSVSRWTVAELDAAKHNFELPGKTLSAREARPVQVHVDTAHIGLGGAGKGNDKLFATASQFMISPRCSPWKYRLRLRPLTTGTWFHDGRRTAERA